MKYIAILQRARNRALMRDNKRSMLFCGASGGHIVDCKPRECSRNNGIGVCKALVCL